MERVEIASGVPLICRFTPGIEWEDREWLE